MKNIIQQSKNGMFSNYQNPAEAEEDMGEYEEEEEEHQEGDQNPANQTTVSNIQRIHGGNVIGDSTSEEMIIIEEDEEEEDSQSQYLPQNQLDNIAI